MGNGDDSKHGTGSYKRNGFAIKGWSDIGSFLLLVTFIISGLVWGMKLESRYDALDNRYDELARQVGNGILPRAEERIRALEKEQAEDKAIVRRLEQRMTQHGVNGGKH